MPALVNREAVSQTPLERHLTRIWETILAVAPIARSDNFFDLGGTSLDALKVANRIESSLGRQVDLVSVFQAPTIEKLAIALEDTRELS